MEKNGEINSISLKFSSRWNENISHHVIIFVCHASIKIVTF